MTAPLLALLLSVADPLGFPPVGGLAAAVAPTPTATATATATPAPTATPTPTSAATPAATSAPSLTLPAGPGLGNLALPAVALALLAVVTLIFSRRKQQESRLVRVLETTALGPRRSLVVARLGDELLVIGASESGLQLLAARPAFDDLGEAARLRAVPDLAAAAAGAAPAEPRQNPLVAALGRLRGAASRGTPSAAGADAGPERATFDALLAESAEDLELRRKLARGQSGSVR